MSDILRRLREPSFGTETSERNLMAAAADEIERLSKREQELVEALGNYMSQFGQALEANGIPYSPPQQEADERARRALQGTIELPARTISQTTGENL